jgi:hypothetical protein
VKKLIVAALGLPLLSACATTGLGAPDPSNSSNAFVCRNTALEEFVGRPATADLGAQVLRASGAKSLQWVAAGMMVTMDFREDRVRVHLDERNRVQRVSCG